jgi:hypothetical protein
MQLSGEVGRRGEKGGSFGNSYVVNWSENSKTDVGRRWFGCQGKSSDLKNWFGSKISLSGV